MKVYLRDRPDSPGPEEPAVPTAGLRMAVIGGGIAGLAAAWRLSQDPCIRTTLLEAEPRFGGHAHAVDVTLPDVEGRAVTHPVDVGFLVCNERTYPGLLALFEVLGIELARSDMSFSVQSTQRLSGRAGRFEWSGADFRSVFAQPRNLLSPRFWAMLAEILRFNRLATALARQPDGDEAWFEPLGEFLTRHRFGSSFQQGYLLPMIACIWSCPPEQMLRFPVATLIRFCHNHGLLQVEGRPGWFTVRGGSGRYVERIVSALPDARATTAVRMLQRRGGKVRVLTHHGAELFDSVIVACHAPQALRLLGEDATVDERRLLGAMRTQPNTAVLHTDASLLPRSSRAWAAWNFERATADADAAPVCLHYWINRLQPLPFRDPVIVSLNPIREPDPRSVLGRWAVQHPVFDLAAIEAQRELPNLQGQGGVYFAGAWTGYGFHEDGYQSGVAAADAARRRTVATRA